VKHRAMVTAESDGDWVTIRLTCDACDGGDFTLRIAHIETLARVLPRICHEVGIKLDDGVTETHVFNLSDSENRAAAEAMYKDFVQRRRAIEH
jgi:hypothetical protein